MALQGIAIGNGYVNANLNIDTSVRFAYGHGIIDEKSWNTLEQQCCRGCIGWLLSIKRKETRRN